MNVVIPKPYPKQAEFMRSRSHYTAYGGSRGGGKSFVARLKARMLCMRYDGIQILFMRRTYPELRENHIIPAIKELKGVAEYKSADKAFEFPNGSRLKFGYCRNDSDLLQYQGQAYDVIFLEECTLFPENVFTTMTESNRSSGQMHEFFSPRMYLTCNPGEHIGADGVDWAVRRIEDGLQKPVDIIWELGNEYDYSLSFTQQEYISLCRDAIAVIRSVDPNAKIACHADTTLVSKGLSGDDSGYLWDKAVLESLGDKIDYMIVHSYYSGSNAYKVPAVIEKVNKDILNITGENRIKVIISEHSWWASDIYSNQYKIRSMYSLGQTADYYLRLTDYPNVVSSAYHSLFADDDFVPGGILKLTALMCRYTTGDNLKTSITCNNSQYSKYVTACATKADNGINLVLNNTSVDDTYQVTVDTNLSAVKMVDVFER